MLVWEQSLLAESLWDSHTALCMSLYTCTHMPAATHLGKVKPTRRHVGAYQHTPIRRQKGKEGGRALALRHVAMQGRHGEIEQGWGVILAVVIAVELGSGVARG